MVVACFDMFEHALPSWCDKNNTGRLGFFKTFIFLVIFTGCAGPQPETAFTPWQMAGFSPVNLATNSFHIFAAYKTLEPGQDAVIYIEGDGHAWVSKNQQSTNPTPVDNLVSRLAMRDKRPNVVYLARPCQYIGMTQAPCAPDYWAGKRFSPEVIASMSQALDQIKAVTRSEHLSLIGYSGGGAVAVLLAASRNDITGLTTIAGNLDTELYTQLHQVSPMTESLNPRNVANRLGDLPQTHYVGGKDDNVPQAIAQSFMQALPAQNRATLKIIPEATHSHGWDDLDVL